MIFLKEKFVNTLNFSYFKSYKPFKISWEKYELLSLLLYYVICNMQPFAFEVSNFIKDCGFQDVGHGHDVPYKLSNTPLSYPIIGARVSCPVSK